MPTPRVHGAWSPQDSLLLWVEVPRRAPGPAREPDLAALAALGGPPTPTLLHALGAARRRRIGLVLPTTAAGRATASTSRARTDTGLREHELETSEVLGPVVLDVLEEVGRLPAAAAGDGLRWLAHLAVTVAGAVAAGSVVPDLHEDPVGSGRFRARWIPLPDKRFQRWRTAMAEVCPPVLRVVDPDRGAAADVLDAAVATLCDLRMLRVGAGVRPAPGPTATAVTAWVDALVHDGEVEAGGLTGLARRVRDWQRSGETTGFDLVLRVVEPVGGAEPEEGRTWRLQARLRPVDDPSVLLTTAQARAEAAGGSAGGPGGGEDPLLVFLAAVTRAGTAWPPLRGLLTGNDRTDVDLTTEQLLDLVETGAPRLTAAGVVVQLPRRWTKRALTLSLAVSAGQPGAVTDPQLRRDDLTAFRWQVALGGEELTPAELSLLVESRSELVQFRGEWVQVDPEVLQRCAEFLRRKGSGQASLADVLASLSSRALPAPVVDLRAAGVLGDLLSGTAEHRLAPLPAPRGVRATLRPYQARGVSWLAAMTAAGLGAVLADDMGLGKTLQLLTLLQHEAETSPGRGPTLLICPMSVIGNWRAEAARFTPELRVLLHHGPQRARGEEFDRAAAGHDLVLCTYGLLVRDVEDLARTAWRRVALDEAQHVKNTATRAARSVRALRAGHRVALTGTPVENRLEDLRAVLDTANPGILGSVAAFRDTFAVPIEKLGQAEPARRLATLTRPFLLRRVKTDPTVAGDLPEKIEMTVRANLTPEQAALYQAVVEQLLKRLAEPEVEGVSRQGLVLATLTRLKQICNHPAHYLADGSALLHRGRHRSGKLELLDDVVGAALDEGEKVLCFTQFAEFGSRLAPHLAERAGREVAFLHGGVSRSGRDRMVEEFADPAGPPVMVLSLKAGGTGLNLTAANHVVHVDRWWNPAVEDQATDRAFRIGQKRRVQVRKFVCAGTVEERIDAMITRKQDLAGAVVGAGESWIGDLDDDALRELVVLGADAVGD
ncbi:DEAD/DEAH box helicase [Kineococcus gynurae]|uniref:DEAD/DEAH box helicase n=1 Tax=Kineococcus gynurae TaxID=452979 RepID=A0ABV5LP02_9ACTN